MSTIKEFTDLLVWQEGHRAVLFLYKVTEKFPTKERFSLIDQMRRAAVSVTSNVAEGFGRHSYKEKIPFYYQAQGSLVELKNQVLISRDIGYLSTEDFKILTDHLDNTHRLLQGLITKSKSFLNPES